MGEPMRGFVRRHRGTVFLLLILGVAVLSGQYYPPPGTKPDAPIPNGAYQMCSGVCAKDHSYAVLPYSFHQGLPLNFEWNLGQADSRYQLLAHGKGYTIY